MKRAGATSYVVLGNSRRVSGRHVFEIARPWPTALPDRLFDGAWEDGAVFVKPHERLKKKGPYLALRTLDFEGALILHTKVVAKLKKVFPEVCEGARKMDDGEHVLLPVERYVPIDREASTLDLAGRGNEDPFRAHIYRLTKLAFAHPEGLPPLFRLVECPSVVVARQDVADLLVELTSKEIATSEGSPMSFPPSSSQVAPMRIGDAKEAHAAFWRLLGGKSKSVAKDRKTALTHPTLACAVALGIDRKAGADTRKAACAHPFWAVMYAVHVDRGTHSDTKKAAQADLDGAVEWATSIDLAIDDALAKRMLTKKGWWDEPSVDGAVSSTRERYAKFRGAGASRPTFATRDLPKVKAVKPYLEKAKGPLAPLAVELRSDVEAMTKHGRTLLALAADAHPSDVIDAVHLAVSEVQSGLRKIPAGNAGMQFRLGLACAIADALHRGLGWQWAQVGGTTAVVSPRGTHGVVPLHPITRAAKKGVRENTIALMFNMIVAGSLPPAGDGVAFIS